MTTNETVPDVREVMEEAAIPELGRLLTLRLTAKAALKDMEAEVKDLDASITQLLTDQGCPKVSYDGYRVAIVAASRSTLSKDKLVELGVPAATIKAAMVETRYNFIRVDPPKA